MNVLKHYCIFLVLTLQTIGYLVAATNEKYLAQRKFEKFDS
jgi:hypothetical protein